MWHVGIGPLEIAVLFAVAMVLSFSSRTRRWMVAVLPCLVLGVVVSPPDPVSMLLVGVPLIAVLALGVSLSPFLRPSRSA